MIRIYGHVGGEGSFRQVTAGMVRATSRLQRFAGLMPIDRIPGYDEPVAPGADADVALHCGAPLAITASHTQGRHKRHYLLLAPNSDGVPPVLAAALKETISTFTGHGQRVLLDGLLAPSKWAADVLRNVFDKPVIVAPHGVDPDVFFPALDVHQSRVAVAGTGYFRVLHLTSTLGQRKGTRELLVAWRSLIDRSKLPDRATLTLVVNPLAVTDFLWELRELGMNTSSVTIAPNPQAPQADMATALRWAHLVVQPSRAEGFGLVPLEARACGTPVCATLCTGHSEHMSHGSAAVVPIEYGPDDQLDDFPGARAPTVAPEAIAAAIEKAAADWHVLSAAAMGSAVSVGHERSWERQNRAALAEIDTQS